ncbi:DUF5686 and carboxypeptidase regulatory-like domain-containing protein [Chitinophaga nivalis]|uniref:DUF5686 and carboxypeptidase regulatory-like domain-containing protein n=1 Tax=Chitinophaga nivalis TaxID=2991709 RepID=A0ABT3IUE0_9BACT|nr:DUF5686 and carboxypeptidase regulatory-like domain-containing protein [Chitinophaga nivalis]MCW3462751.1 DUF5686 and carboxypeptidase regulatory-like domain-containing protein [Chitinophaga nivalis]MCW3487559.1 DUF5686 and carboxypeptidase regulatory-like domain-containing protein [Chitinophaga nivalis]
MAQTFKVSGIVKDAHSQEIIPFATLQFVGTQIGMVSNTDGKYVFELGAIPADSLLVRVMGYNLLKLPVDRSQKEQIINFEVTRSDLSLKVYEIKANVNFALILLKQIVRHKPENNYNRLDNYKYQIYNKLELDMKNLNKVKLSKNRFTKPFSFILDNIDSTSEEKPFLPIFLTESLSDYYYQSKPHKTKEIIKAARTSGIDNESVTKFLGGMYQNINIYENFIPVFDKQFVSPTHHNGAFYYDYKIADTQYVNSQRFIKLNFTPKRKGENTFIGDLWVHDTTYAIQKTTLSVPRDANINFIHKVSLVQEFKQLPDSTWFLYKDKFIADFWAPSPRPGKQIEFIGRKTTSYDEVVIGDTAVTNIFNNKKYPQNIVILDSARKRQDAFWTYNRPDSLSKNEQSIYRMVDTLQKMPLFQKYSNTIRFLATGYKPFGPLEWGPYYYAFSQNRLEGFRLRLDLGTTPKFNKDLYLYGYLAYGFKDEAYKGKISALWLLKRHPRTYVYGAYTRDLDNGTHYYDEVGTDNIFTLAIRKGGIPQKFLMVDEKRVEFFKEYYSGFSHQLSFIHKQVRPFEPLPTADFYPKGVNGRDPLTSAEIELKVRYAFHEEFLEGNYYRVSLGSKFPIAEFKFALGIPGIGRSGQQYERASLSISDYVKLPPFGSFYYNVFGGKIFGTLPYTGLEVHPGNEIYYYNKYAFNMMNRFEFISDQYAGFNIEHTIGNGIFGYIPLIKKLKWRQFWTAKGVIGSLSESNKQLNMNNGYTFKTLQGNPYLELGTGIENIFKFLRVDFIWRVTPAVSPEEPINKRFGVFGSFKLQF